MAQPRVYVTRRLPDAALALLRSQTEVTLWATDEVPPPRDELLGQMAGKEGLLCLLTDRIDAPLLDAAPSLRVVSNCAVGFDNIDVAAATERGIAVTNTPGVLTETTADFAFALMLSAARRVVEADRYTRAGRWRSWEPMLLLGQDLHGATLGLVGLGRIGAAVARRARGFGMTILYHDLVRREELESELCLRYTSLECLLREADFVSVHVPLTQGTHHLIGEAQLRAMKPTAILVNTARGAVVDTNALYRAVVEGWIAGAGLDVFEVEPVPLDHPLLSIDNVVLAPHIASASVATRTKMAMIAAGNLVQALAGSLPPDLVNGEVWEKRRL